MRTCSGRLGGGGVCPGGGRLPMGVSAWAGWCLSRAVIHLPLPCGKTDAYENITFPQLPLRTVIKCYEKFHKVALQRNMGHGQSRERRFRYPTVSECTKFK